ncbi:ATP-binding protein [Nitrosomonas sp.]|uniref:ATP-binding protein n=1 Tax=Nitrosomonas sp. TaxID=42353 RepID=UPI0025ED6ACF|nr:ATP-binding protein [Nitrosomonas sp.]
MESTKQSNRFDEMQNISNLAEIAIGNAMDKAKKSEFIQEFGICDTHGQYPANMQDTNGVLRSYRPPGCPACLKLENAARLLGKSNIPKRFLSCDFDNYETSTDVQKKALHQCKSFAENFAIHRKNGACLLLCGRPGTGKNHLATAISKKLLSDGFSVLRVKASQYLDAYWAKSFEEREGWLNDIAKVDLIMIDEIGRSSNAKSAQDAFFRLIDARYEAQLPTMIATNMNRDELIEVLGEATYDRFRQGGSTRITFDWESYRPNAAMQDSGDI